VNEGTDKGRHERRKKLKKKRKNWKKENKNIHIKVGKQ
jgi:uncharacterized protein YheU (UPF0270 family)